MALIAITAMSTVIASTAAAKPANLDLIWGGGETEAPNQLAPGENVHIETREALVATNLGNITCRSETFPPGEEGFVGADQTNNEKTDNIALENAVRQLTGEGGGGACSGAGVLGPNAYVKIYNPSSPERLGVLSLQSNGTAIIRSPSPGEPIFVELRVSEGKTKCMFSFTQLKGTATASHPGYFNRLEISFSQKLAFNKAVSDSACPTAATLTIPNAILTRWEGQFTAYYINETGLS